MTLFIAITRTLFKIPAANENDICPCLHSKTQAYNLRELEPPWTIPTYALRITPFIGH